MLYFKYILAALLTKITNFTIKDGNTAKNIICIILL